MKRIIVLILSLLVIVTCTLPAYAEGITVRSDSGDRVSLFENMKIDTPVNGNVISVFGDVEVNADVNGLVVTVLGNAKVNARVGGEVITVLGDSWVGKNAVINGSLFSLGSYRKEPGAMINGQEVKVLGKAADLNVNELLIVRIVLLLLYAIIVFLVGILYIAASKRKVTAIEKDMEKDLGKKLLLGFLAYLGATILLALLFITVIVPVLYFVLVVFAAVMSSIYLGKLIMKAMSPTSSIYLEFITGLVTITLLELLATFLVPGDDFLMGMGILALLGFVIHSFGTGILFMAKYGNRQA